MVFFYVYNHSSLQKAIELLDKCIKSHSSRKHEITFLTGVVGPLALAAVILHSQNKEEEAKKLIKKYINFKNLALYIC